MAKKLFILTAHCTSEAHCQTCRATTSAGEKFRTSMAAAYDVPVCWPACPPERGAKPMGYVRPRHVPRQKPAPKSRAVPRERWPAWALTVAELAQQGDKGVGDTVARMTAASGIKSAVEWVKAKTGWSCGCGKRHADWNALYPY